MQKGSASSHTSRHIKNVKEKKQKVDQKKLLHGVMKLQGEALPQAEVLQEVNKQRYNSNPI